MTFKSNWVLVVALVLLGACSRFDPAPDAALPEVSAEHKEQCESLGVVSRLADGRQHGNFDRQAAMNLAIEEVIARGGNAYHLLDSDDTLHGTQVIVEALDCS